MLCGALATTTGLPCRNSFRCAIHTPVKSGGKARAALEIEVEKEEQEKEKEKEKIPSPAIWLYLKRSRPSDGTLVYKGFFLASFSSVIPAFDLNEQEAAATKLKLKLASEDLGLPDILQLRTVATLELSGPGRLRAPILPDLPPEIKTAAGAKGQVSANKWHGVESEAIYLCSQSPAYCALVWEKGVEKDVKPPRKLQEAVKAILSFVPEVDAQVQRLRLQEDAKVDGKAIKKQLQAKLHVAKQQIREMRETLGRMIQEKYDPERKFSQTCHSRPAGVMGGTYCDTPLGQYKPEWWIAHRLDWLLYDWDAMQKRLWGSAKEPEPEVTRTQPAIQPQTWRDRENQVYLLEKELERSDSKIHKL